MARKRTIVGIGEAVLVELADRDEPAGIASAIAINATMLGSHRPRDLANRPGCGGRGARRAPLVHTALAAHEGRAPHGSGLHEAIVVALVHAAVCGWSLDKALRLAEAFARHRREYPLKPTPSSMMETTGG